MLRSSKSLEGYKLGATNGEIGRVKEFYFDDQMWTVRYLVADTGHWLTGRQVLISPFAVRSVDVEQEHVNVELTKERIEHSPSIDTEKPVSRQYEVEYYKYYGWPMYWYGPALWGPTPYPIYGHGGTWMEPNPQRMEEPADPHLRSTREVYGYYIQAGDGDIGHVEDFLLDDQNWAIRYLVVDTRNWLPGKKVLVSPEWISAVSWDKSSVVVDLSRETIEKAPEFRVDQPVTRAYEADLHSYYQREGYWERSGHPELRKVA